MTQPPPYIELPAGRYYIGDPELLLDRCYYQHFFRDFPQAGCYEIDTKKMLVDYCGFCEGTYQDYNGTRYRIQSGTIGFIPHTWCRETPYEEVLTIAQAIVFTDPVLVYSNGNGLFEVSASNYFFTIDTQLPYEDSLEFV